MEGLSGRGVRTDNGKVVRGRGAHVVVIKWDIVRRTDGEIYHTNSPAKVNSGNSDGGWWGGGYRHQPVKCFSQVGAYLLSGSCVSLMRATSSLSL